MAAPDKKVATREVCRACFPGHPSPKLAQLSLDESEAIFHGLPFYRTSQMGGALAACNQLRSGYHTGYGGVRYQQWA